MEAATRLLDDQGPLGRAYRSIKRKQVLHLALLLHDLGPELADICAAGAAPSEWRTTPLVGLGLRSEFLHNGRAQRLEGAIRLHGGEAEAASAAFESLPFPAQQQVLRFLQSL